VLLVLLERLLLFPFACVLSSFKSRPCGITLIAFSMALIVSGQRRRLCHH
jgi:hypothetical protein